MNNLEKLTVIIVTYNTTEKIILDCLNSIRNNAKVVIVENSNHFIHKDKIISKYPKTTIYCTGENLGYGGGNNYGLQKVKTDYGMILNPDTILDKSFFRNINPLLNNKSFSLIGC